MAQGTGLVRNSDSVRAPRRPRQPAQYSSDRWSPQGRRATGKHEAVQLDNSVDSAFSESSPVLPLFRETANHDWSAAARRCHPRLASAPPGADSSQQSQGRVCSEPRVRALPGKGAERRLAGRAEKVRKMARAGGECPLRPRAPGSAFPGTRKLPTREQAGGPHPEEADQLRRTARASESPVPAHHVKLAPLPSEERDHPTSSWIYDSVANSARDLVLACGLFKTASFVSRTVACWRTFCSSA